VTPMGTSCYLSSGLGPVCLGRRRGNQKFLPQSEAQQQQRARPEVSCRHCHGGARPTATPGECLEDGAGRPRGSAGRDVRTSSTVRRWRTSKSLYDRHGVYYFLLLGWQGSKLQGNEP
jgi:hypothetical protein